jgi:hypothetical protein
MIHTSRVSSARRFLALFLFYLKNFILPCFYAAAILSQWWWRNTNFRCGCSNEHVTYFSYFRKTSWRGGIVASSTKCWYIYSFEPPCPFTKKGTGWKDCWSCPSVGQFVAPAPRWCKFVDIYIFFILFPHIFFFFMPMFLLLCSRWTAYDQGSSPHRVPIYWVPWICRQSRR